MPSLQDALKNAFPELKETHSAKTVPLRKPGKTMTREEAERRPLHTEATDNDLQFTREVLDRIGDEDGS